MAQHDESNNRHSSLTRTDTENMPDSSTSRSPLVERTAAMHARLAERRAAEAEARAAYPGDCFDCQDTGFVEHGVGGQTPCTKCERGRAILAERTQAHREQTVREYLTRGGVASRRLTQTFDTYPVTAKTSAVVAYLRNFAVNWDEKIGLILTGSYGTGKSGLLVATLRELVSRYVPEYNPDPYALQPIAYSEPPAPLWFTTSTDFFDALRGGYNDGSYAHLLARAKRVKILALDDLGAEKPTEWVQERLFSVVNDRYEREMPVCVTTNYGLEALGERIGPRVLERLLECCAVVSVNGDNLRTRE